MKLFVTGAKGFLGRFLVTLFKESGYDVTAPSSSECDLRRRESLQAFTDVKYDRIFHLAAWTQAGDFCLRHPGEQWLINQLINTQVLDWWHSSQPQAKLISVGTSCSYDPESPLHEDFYLKGSPIESLYTYGMTKRMLLVGQMSLAKQFGHKFLTVVPSTLYGAGYHTDGRQMHFIFDLIRKIFRGKRFGEPVVLWGDGHQKRELILVDDFAKTLLRLDSIVENRVVNIGAGEEHSIRQFAEIICSEVGYDSKKIQYDTSKYVGAKSKCLQISELKKLIPEFKPIDLHSGLAETIRWFEGQSELLSQ